MSQEFSDARVMFFHNSHNCLNFLRMIPLTFQSFIMSSLTLFFLRPTSPCLLGGFLWLANPLIPFRPLRWPRDRLI
ncbi:hypothetical protein BGX38DRAFT_1229853, partial [Terfezia claveryi]